MNEPLIARAVRSGVNPPSLDPDGAPVLDAHQCLHLAIGHHCLCLNGLKALQKRTGEMNAPLTRCGRNCPIGGRKLLIGSAPKKPDVGFHSLPRVNMRLPPSRSTKV